MIHRLEEKNSIMMKKLESEPGSKNLSLRTTPTSSKGFESNDHSKQTEKRNSFSVRDSSNVSDLMKKPFLAGSPTSQIKNAKTSVGIPMQNQDSERLNLKVQRLGEENTKLQQEIKSLNSSLLNKNAIIKNYNTKINDLTAQLDNFKRENTMLFASNNKLRSISETEKLALSRVHSKLRNQEALLHAIENSAKRNGDAKKQVQKIIYDCTTMLEAKYTKGIGQNEHELQGARGLLTGKLQSLERSLTQLTEDAHHTLATAFKQERPPKEANEELVSRYIDYSEMKSFESSEEDPTKLKDRLLSRLSEIDMKLKNLEEIEKDQASQSFVQERKSELKNLLEFLNMERDEILHRLQCKRSSSDTSVLELELLDYLTPS